MSESAGYNSVLIGISGYNWVLYEVKQRLTDFYLQCQMSHKNEGIVDMINVSWGLK